MNAFFKDTFALTFFKVQLTVDLFNGELHEIGYDPYLEVLDSRYQIIKETQLQDVIYDIVSVGYMSKTLNISQKPVVVVKV